MSSRDDLRRELDAIAARASAVVRRRRGARAFRLAVPRGLLLAPTLPLLGAMLAVAAMTLGRGAPLGWFALLIGAVLVPIAYILTMTQRARSRPVSRGDALGVVDQELGLEDRLQTADEFLGRTERSSFAEAAIDDAAEHLGAARRCELAEASGVITVPWRAHAAVAAALLLAIVPALIVEGGAMIAAEPPTSGAIAFTQGGDEADPDTVEFDPADPEAEDADGDMPREATPARTGRNIAVRQPLPPAMRESQGRLGSGQPAEAEAAGAQSAARGAPSAQGQPAKAGKPPKTDKPTAKPRTSEREREEEEPPRSEHDPAGSTAGQGASRGGRRNPSVSDWSSRDQVATPGEEDEVQEDEVEDEDESQESRGGVQPNLRDRRPPVNRDLRIGFGNQKSPDANGRGGPSAQKKSRGVASLVLGVPIPDRIKGQPNPGRTKVTQQRIEPTREAADGVVAESRGQRSSPIVESDRALGLSPWMRTMLRQYYLSLRQKDDEAS